MELIGSFGLTTTASPSSLSVVIGCRAVADRNRYLHQQRIADIGRRPGDDHGVAVGLRVHHSLIAEMAGGANFVFNDDRLPDQLAQRLRVVADHQVAAATGSVGANDFDWAIRIVRRASAERPQHQRSRARNIDARFRNRMDVSSKRCERVVIVSK